MALKLIDMDTWECREFYEHFISEVVCTYSAVVNMDITNLKGQKLYPAMIWLLTKTVNDMPEFRTSLTPEGLGIPIRIRHPGWSYRYYHSVSDRYFQ